MDYLEGDIPPITAKNGDIFQISLELWQKNKQQANLLLRYFALPLKETDNNLWLGVDALNNLNACEMFSFLSGKIVEPVLLDTVQLKQYLQQLNPLQVKERNEAYQITSEEELQNIEDSDEPIICLLNQIFESALRESASDIHLEPQTKQMRVRFRIDGVLKIQPPISLNLASRIITRLKLLAKLDISEMRLPQDGSFHFRTTLSDCLDFRLSTLPTPLGEKAVLRLQKNKPVSLQFEALGMTEQQQILFQQILSQPQGLILVTGPTGSGKSITLYTALSCLNKVEKHILTAEDPIEIELDGIIQSQVNTQIGLDFAKLLRTFLRQDPDIIMLGEIRDEESAAMALRAAQTGHLVLSTLHTNDALSALDRLRQLGIQQYEIDSCLLLVIAQRLVRKLCQECRNKEKNCNCHQGYTGRIGVYQFLRPSIQLDHYQYQPDFPTLRDSAMLKVEQEITDLAEVERILGG